ncbi:MAG TPA: hypothetical protein VNH18_20535 [Bryobacteraceae bacterium]|nr:hypothetical protein [Bryobacteraceae bacterium]
MWTSALIAAMACTLSGAVVIDRIAVIVNRHVVKASDVDRDLRVTAFLNNEQPKLDTAARKSAAERLIDQALIRNEISAGGYRRASDEEAGSLLNGILRDRFGGSGPRLHQALVRVGLSEDTLRTQLAWQLTVLQFIDERFRAGVLVTDEDLRRYYDENRSRFPRPFEAEREAIRKLLEGEQVNQQFETWLEGARKRATIQYREEGLK